MLICIKIFIPGMRWFLHRGLDIFIFHEVDAVFKMEKLATWLQITNAVLLHITNSTSSQKSRKTQPVHCAGRLRLCICLRFCQFFCLWSVLIYWLLLFSTAFKSFLRFWINSKGQHFKFRQMFIIKRCFNLSGLHLSLLIPWRLEVHRRGMVFSAFVLLTSS